MLEETGFLKHSGGVLACSGFATCFQGNTEYDYFVVSPCLAAFASQPKVLDGPSWPHAPVTLSFSNLRSTQVLFRHKRFLKPTAGTVGPKQEIKDAAFSWEIGAGDPVSFAAGFKEWL